MFHVVFRICNDKWLLNFIFTTVDMTHSFIICHASFTGNFNWRRRNVLVVSFRQIRNNCLSVDLWWTNCLVLFSVWTKKRGESWDDTMHYKMVPTRRYIVTLHAWQCLPSCFSFIPKRYILLWKSLIFVPYSEKQFYKHVSIY